MKLKNKVESEVEFGVVTVLKKFEKIGKVVGKDVEKVKLGCDPVEIKSCDC